MIRVYFFTLQTFSKKCSAWYRRTATFLIPKLLNVKEILQLYASTSNQIVLYFTCKTLKMISLIQIWHDWRKYDSALWKNTFKHENVLPETTIPKKALTEIFYSKCVFHIEHFLLTCIYACFYAYIYIHIPVYVYINFIILFRFLFVNNSTGS